MRKYWVVGAAAVVLAGCGGDHVSARHGNAPLSGESVRAAFRRDGFRIIYDARLATMSDAQLARAAKTVYGPPGSGLTAKDELDGVKALRARGMSELLAVALGSQRAAHLADVGVWQTGSRAKRVITQALRSLRKANHNQKVVLPWTRVRNVIVFASSKPPPTTNAGLRDVERRLADSA